MIKLIDTPKYIDLLTYETAISAMVERLSKQPAVQSVYQIGGVSTPGVSDIDMLVVFKPGQVCHMNPLDSLSATERYLFVHHLYGLPADSLHEVPRLLFFHNYKHLWGSEQAALMDPSTNEDLTIVNQQVGLEYLLKMHITLTIERTYGIVKVRNLLLHAKALLYDLDYLDINSGELMSLVHHMLNWRDHWFKSRPSDTELFRWLENFYAALTETLAELFQRHSFYVASWTNLKISRNISLSDGSPFACSHSGISLPSALGGLGRRYFNVQNRFNRFAFQLPIKTENLPGLVSQRAEIIGNMNLYNRKHLPNFIPVAYGLNIFNPPEQVGHV